MILCLFFFLSNNLTVGQGLLIHEFSRSHITTHHVRYDSSGRVISYSQRLLQNNTQHSKQTNIPASGGIRTHNFSRRASAGQRLRPFGHRVDNFLFPNFPKHKLSTASYQLLALTLPTNKSNNFTFLLQRTMQDIFLLTKAPKS